MVALTVATVIIDVSVTSRAERAGNGFGGIKSS